MYRKGHRDDIPRPVILYVVFLDLLDMVVCLWAVHSLGILPRKVTQKAEACQAGRLEPEDRVGKEPRDDSVVLSRDVEHGGNGSVGGDEDVPDGHASGDCYDVVFGPVARRQSRLAQDRCQNGGVQSSTP